MFCLCESVYPYLDLMSYMSFMSLAKADMRRCRCGLIFICLTIKRHEAKPYIQLDSRPWIVALSFLAALGWAQTLLGFNETTLVKVVLNKLYYILQIILCYLATFMVIELRISIVLMKWKILPGNYLICIVCYFQS